MPDDNDTDAPAPEDMNFPDTLRITIASADEAFDEAVEAAGAAEAGEQHDAGVSFETAEGIRTLLTDLRLELLRSLMGQPAESITDLADRLDRSYSAVHGDVEVLAEWDDRAVAVRDGPVVATSFHPELTDDARVHDLAFFESEVATAGSDLG